MHVQCFSKKRKGSVGVARLLLVVAIVAVVYLLVRSYRKNSASMSEDADGAITEDMVRCTHCGVHLPKSESLSSGENYYCSKAHLDAHRK
ncbi:MAG: PP0621 family protein [Gallionella sp.]